MYLFASEACIPLRAAPSESSEMVSQLLFGDVVEGYEVEENWIRVKSLDDGYEGWATSYMLTPLPESELWQISSWQYVHSPDSCLELEDGSLLRLPLGARVPVFQSFENETGKIFQIGQRKWQLRNNGVFPLLPPDLISVTARKFLNAPYLWGGRGSFGIDCSGFTQVVFRMHGISLLRDASQQAQQGIEVLYEEAKVGDLAFFSSITQKNISHVGILLSKDEIIHSSGKVCVAKNNPLGLFSYESRRQTHKLLFIKRYF